MATARNAGEASKVARPRQLGRYELIARLGQGGMAEVYLARQKGPMNFEKVVVVKAIHPHLAEQEKFIHMLLDEARIAALIKHPRVVDIYDLGESEGTYFIAMEYLAGQSMAKIITAGRKGKAFDALSTAQVVADCADGLHAAHILADHRGNHLGLVHRDVAPGNIIVLYDGGVKLLDFGISKASGRLAETQVGKVKGKIGYAAPEQIVGEEVDPRSDVFSLGVVLWESLALGRLFRANDTHQAMQMLERWTKTPPSRHRKEVPRELDEVCLKALQLDPADRFQTALEMRDALRAVLRRKGFDRDDGRIESQMQAAFRAEKKEQEALIRKVSEASAEIDVARIVRTRLESTESSPLAAPPSAGKPAPPLPPHLRRQQARSSAPSPRAQEVPGQAHLEASRAPPSPPSPSPAPASPPAPAPPPAPAVHTVPESMSAAPSGALRAAALRHKLEAARQERWFWPAVAGTVAVALLIIAAATDGEPSKLTAARSESADALEPGTPSISNADPASLTPGSSSMSASDSTSASASNTDTDSDSASNSDSNTDPDSTSDPASPSPSASDSGATSDSTSPSTSDSPSTSSSNSTSDSPPPPRRQRSPKRESSAPKAPRDPPRRGGAYARAQSYYQQGLRLMNQGDLRAAKTKFYAALSTHPGFAPAYRGLGLLYERSGNKRAAIRAYRRYLRRAPDAPDSSRIRARVRDLGG